MIIKSLRLTDFRNIESLDIKPNENVNVIFGNNAQGKTNLVEAIFLLSGKKSFRSSTEQDYIRFGESTALIEVNFFSEGRDQTLSISYGGKKNILLNDIPISIGEVMGKFFCVEFSPQLLAIIKDGPSERRNFLDSCISEVMPRYMHTLNNYKKVIAERNALLGDVKYNSSLLSVLDAWDESLAKLSFSLINARKRYINRLSPFTSQYYELMCGGRESFSMEYESSFPITEDMDRCEAEATILESLKKARTEDIKYGHTTLGAHRDDVIFKVNGMLARSFASQGQQRSIVIALKLAECEVIKQVCGENPILLLDDVLSELDKKRRDFFLKNIHTSQIFITCCDRNMLKGMNIGKTFKMVNGKIMTGGK